MPGDGLQRIRERLQQNRLARNESIALAVNSARDNERVKRGTVVAGDKVFDTVTGEEGTVVYGTRETVVRASAE